MDLFGYLVSVLGLLSQLVCLSLLAVIIPLRLDGFIPGPWVGLLSPLFLTFVVGMLYEFRFFLYRMRVRARPTTTTSVSINESTADLAASSSSSSSSTMISAYSSESERRTLLPHFAHTAERWHEELSCCSYGCECECENCPCLRFLGRRGGRFLHAIVPLLLMTSLFCGFVLMAIKLDGQYLQSVDYIVFFIPSFCVIGLAVIVALVYVCLFDEYPFMVSAITPMCSFAQFVSVSFCLFLLLQYVLIVLRMTTECLDVFSWPIIFMPFWLMFGIGLMGVARYFWMERCRCRLSIANWSGAPSLIIITLMLGFCCLFAIHMELESHFPLWISAIPLWVVVSLFWILFSCKWYDECARVAVGTDFFEEDEGDDVAESHESQSRSRSVSQDALL